MRKVMLYVQSTAGTGHIRTALNLAHELKNDFEVLIVYGGVDIPFKIPKKVVLHKLPSLIDDPENRKELVAKNYSIDYTKKQRTIQLLELFGKFQPDFLLIEHFPFGRQNFRYEIMPLIKQAHGTRCKVFGSFRGIIGQDHDEEQINTDLDYFDTVFVHTDPKVSVPEFEHDKFIYTGYVASKTDKCIESDIVSFFGQGFDCRNIIAALKSHGIDSHVSTDYDELLAHIAGAQTVICSAGYNAAVESMLAESSVWTKTVSK